MLQEFFVIDDMEYYATEEMAPEIEGTEEVEWYVRTWNVKRPQGRRFT